MKQTTRLSRVRLFLVLGIIGIFCVLLWGCGGGSSSTNNSFILNTNTGIQGRALLYPEGSTQNPTPLANAVITIQPFGGGVEIARQQTDGQGNFQFLLLQGRYTLVPLPDVPNRITPTGVSMDVTVRTGKFTQVTVGYTQDVP